MRLVEGVVGEREQDLPELVDRDLREAALEHAGLEAGVLLVELLLLLLAHRAAQVVGGTQGEAGEHLRDRHHLLLVDDEAVGLPQHRLERLGERRVDRLDRLAAVLATGVLVVGVGTHRAGTVERADGRDVGERIGLQRAEQRTHAGAVELEDAEGVTAAHQLVGRPVLEAELLQDDRLAAVDLDVADRVVEDAEVGQAEEVHLDQTERLAHRVVELGDDRTVLRPGHDRHDVDERLARHDDAGGVHAPVADLALEADRGLVDGADVGVLAVQRAELAAVVVALVVGVEDVLERDALAHHVGRVGLGDPVADREAVVEDASGVLDGGLGLEPSERRDLGDPVGAVLLADVVDDLAAAGVVEVDVEVGHRGSLGVEEPLEEQPVLERAQVGDPQRVGRDRTRTRATTGTDADAVVLGPVDEVGDHEVVAAVALLRDDRELHLDPVADLLGRQLAGVAGLDAAPHLLAEPRLLALTGWHVGARHVAAGGLGELDLAALGDREGVVARLGHPEAVGPQLAHLGGRLDVVAAAVELEPVGVGEPLAGRHADEGVVGGGVLGVVVVGVVGGDGRQAHLLAEAQQVVADPLLDVDAVVHQLEEHVVAAEDVLELGGLADRLVVLAQAQAGLDRAAGAAGADDEALAVLGEDLLVHPGLEVVPLEARARRQPEEVVHALGALGPHRHVGVGPAAGDVVAALLGEVALAPPHPAALAALGAGGDVGLDADDRLHAVLARLGVEVVGAVEVAVVGHRDGRHAELAGAAEQAVEQRRPVEHGVLGVDVQVHEAVRGAWG